MRRGRLAGTALIAALAVAAPADAKTFEVTRHNDPAPGRCKPRDCSLREAIIAANERAGPDTVLLPDRRPRYGLSQPNTPALADEDEALRGDLDITGPLTLRHPGRGKATVDANKTDRVLEVIAPTVIKRVKLTGGGNVGLAAPRSVASERTSAFGEGGGIESNARLTLKRSVVAGNRAAGGGGIEVFVESTGPDSAPLRLVRSRISNNDTTDSGGGGIDAFGEPVALIRSRITGNNSGNNSGGVRISGGTLRMRDSTIASNRARYSAGGLSVFGASARARITGSTISGNTGLQESGSAAAGIHVSQARLVMTNSTVAGNRGVGIGGGGIGTDSLPGAEVVLNSVTVVRNEADADKNGSGSGGGLFSDNSVGSWSVVNSLIALNHAGDGSHDCSGSFASSGGNLLTTIPPACEGFDPDVGGDFLVANPKVGQLKQNGGPTKTIALRRGSPAINKAIGAKAPNRDQRGVKRKNPDIGAYERRHRR